MFSAAYQDVFETVGIRLRPEDGCTAADIENGESRLGVKLPDSLRDYYLFSGREKRINRIHNRLLPPDKWFVNSGHLVFLAENQNVVYWGVPTNKNQQKDAAVFQGVNHGKNNIEWHAEHESCFTFLKVMALWHASFGGAVSDIATGYVDEFSTREVLDTQWQLVGEVNAMRVYKRERRAVCFLKWEDFIQQQRKLPPWRVFAAAANENELNQIKASLNAQWESWG